MKIYKTKLIVVLTLVKAKPYHNSVMRQLRIFVFMSLRLTLFRDKIVPVKIFKIVNFPSIKFWLSELMCLSMYPKIMFKKTFNS